MIRLDDLAEASHQNTDLELELLDQKISMNRDGVIDIEQYFQNRKSRSKKDDEKLWLEIEDQISYMQDNNSIFKTQ